VFDLRNAERWVLIVLLAALPLLGGGLTPGQGLFLHAVIGLTALVALTTTHHWRRPRSEDIALAVFLALAIAACAVSVYLYASLLCVAQLLDYALVFWLARGLLGAGRWRQRGLWALAIGGGLAAVWGLREYTVTVFVTGDRSWRIFGPFYNPNCLAGYLLLVIPLAVGLMLSAGTRDALHVKSPAPPRRGKRKPPGPPPASNAPRYAEIAAMFVTLTAAFAFLLTGSKGAALGFLVSAVVFAIAAPSPGSRAGRTLRLGTVAVILATLLGALTLPPIRGRILAAFSTQSNSSAFRWYTWIGTAEMIRERPLLGFGPGTFQFAYPRFAHAGFTRMAHESYLQIAGEMGVPALLAILAAVGLVLVRMTRGLKKVYGRERILLASAIAACAGFAVHNLVDYTWYVSAVGLAWWALLGLACGIGDPPVKPKADERPLRPALRWAAVGTLGLTLIAAGCAGRAQLIANSAEDDIRLGSYKLAVEDLTTATRWNPLDAKSFATLSGVEDALRSDPAHATEALDTAISARQRAAALQPTEAVHWVALGRLYAEKGDFQQAEAMTERSLANYPTYTRALLQLARLQEQTGPPGAATATYRKLAAIYDTPIREYVAIEGTVDTAYMYAWEALARDADARGDADAALQYLRLALRLGTTYLETLKANQAIMQAAGAYDPKDADHIHAVGPGIAKRLANEGRKLGASEGNLLVLTAAEFYQGEGETQDAHELLTDLAGKPAPSDPLGRLVTGRALLRRWQLDGPPSRDADLHVQGIALLREALPLAAQAKGWDAEDSRIARDLMR
jgi:putative inorganic carbon (HCO3(-)) transporter